MSGTQNRNAISLYAGLWRSLNTRRASLYQSARLFINTTAVHGIGNFFCDAAVCSKSAGAVNSMSTSLYTGNAALDRFYHSCVIDRKPSRGNL